jgi:hypothetical protein
MLQSTKAATFILVAYLVYFCGIFGEFYDHPGDWSALFSRSWDYFYMDPRNFSVTLSLAFKWPAGLSQNLQGILAAGLSMVALEALTRVLVSLVLLYCCKQAGRKQAGKQQQLADQGGAGGDGGGAAAAAAGDGRQQLADAKAAFEANSAASPAAAGGAGRGQEAGVELVENPMPRKESVAGGDSALSALATQTRNAAL